MPILYHADSGEFHLCNNQVSYIIKVLKNQQLGHLYFGKRINDNPPYDHLLYGERRSLTVNNYENDYCFCLQHIRQEYPSYGTGDFHFPAFDLEGPNGSRISNFVYEKHQITRGKPKLQGLPSTYVEDGEEADTLEVTLFDSLIEARLLLRYTIFRDYPAIARSAEFINDGQQPLVLHHGMSASLDLPDSDFMMTQLSGAWGRECHPKTRHLQEGVQSIGSLRGTSSAEHNPFLLLQRPETTENSGEAYAFSLVYSGNHLEQVEVDAHDATRVMLGIQPHTFRWQLGGGEQFQTPEAVLVYSDSGRNGMSHTFHRLYRSRLARGHWRDRERPVLINNWEATEMSFTQKKLLEIADVASNLGIELFVLDDGWFGDRDTDTAGLGDWDAANLRKLPKGLPGLAREVKGRGLLFGIWIEPEMVNKDSALYRSHPDWILSTPGRKDSHGRNQYVLDLSRGDVEDYLFRVLEKLFHESGVAYVKWDMNRYISECYSMQLGPERQSEVFHRYVLGVYSLYERLTERFPYILFESCSSGGGRFDPGMLYYAPQAWTSDNTDAIERLKIQFGASYVYPPSGMGAHVSTVPNLQVGRCTPLETRANVAFFGDFGYEMDLTALTPEEKELVRQQVDFYKTHRRLFQFGDFYRIASPFEGDHAAWISVAPNKKAAVAGYYRLLREANERVEMLRFTGLNPSFRYSLNGQGAYYGDELMHVGIVVRPEQLCANGKDFSSCLYCLQAVET